MAKNIFSMFQGYVPKPKRNVFDLSFNNNFTTKFGQLTPVLCKEVIPGDSFKIETAAGLRLMPMAFPVQTPMKAYVHYFYVRNRALWKDWQDFITGTKSGLVPPYISWNTADYKKEFFKVGGIADYFGVPNVAYGGFGNAFDGEVAEFDQTYSEVVTAQNGASCSYNPITTTGGVIAATYFPWLSYNQYEAIYKREGLISLEADTLVENSTAVGTLKSDLYRTFTDRSSFLQMARTQLGVSNPDGAETEELKCLPLLDLFHFEGEQPLSTNTFNFEYSFTLPSFYNDDLKHGSYDSLFIAFFDSNERCVAFKHVPCSQVEVVGTTYKYAGFIQLDESLEVQSFYVFSNGYVRNVSSAYNINGVSGQSITFNGFTATITNPDMTNVIGTGNLSNTPFDSEIKLNALPFRAYECIYNSYYRNMQNNPYILNGVEEYNKFIPSKDGGEDLNEYHLHQRNWEYDFMTSSVPSPQFGVAPLVGITMTGTATFQDDNGNTYYAQAELDDDGTITGWSTHSSNMPAGTLRMLMDNVGTGISINDLRNVNSFQRFLENSLRVGLKYRDQIKGHFGVDVRYDELEMPEFIGGMSLDINVNQVTQTADVQDSSYPLAGFAGQAGAFGSSKHAVTKYCDEHGFIIGILSVVPVPVYSQLLPKFFTKNEMLDYFYPEFGHIGYQPILQKEISPLQTFYAGDDLNNVFGYQRAWYDYLASTDEVHAQFRTTLRDFVMNRTFDSAPALNESFLLVDPEQVNDVFLVTGDGEYGPESDKILGQLYFKISKKSPIPVLGIPRLTD